MGSRWWAAGQERSPLSRGQAWPCALRLCCIYARTHLSIHPISEIRAICGFFLAFSDNSEHSILCFQCLAVAALLRSNTTKDEALATARICRRIETRYDIRKLNQPLHPTAHTRLGSPLLMRVETLKRWITYEAKQS